MRSVASFGIGFLPDAGLGFPKRASNPKPGSSRMPGGSYHSSR